MDGWVHGMVTGWAINKSISLILIIIINQLLFMALVYNFISNESVSWAYLGLVTDPTFLIEN